MLDISCKTSAMQMICMKYQVQFILSKQGEKIANVVYRKFWVMF